MKKKAISKVHCVDAICTITRRYRTGDVSLNDLLNASGYCQHSDHITDKDILKRLSDDPSLIEEWALWSQDKRWTPAWGMGKWTGGNWKVEFVEKGGGSSWSVLFADAAHACAFMIRMEMEQLRLMDGEQSPRHVRK